MRMRMAVVMVVMIVAMAVIMVMIVIVAFEEGRLDIEDSFEIEGLAVEHLAERDLSALRAMQPGIRIDTAYACLDLADLSVAHEIGLVDQDHVGEGDLVLRFGGVFQAV